MNIYLEKISSQYDLNNATGSEADLLYDLYRTIQFKQRESLSKDKGERMIQMEFRKLRFKPEDREEKEEPEKREEKHKDTGMSEYNAEDNKGEFGGEEDEDGMDPAEIEDALE